MRGKIKLDEYKFSAYDIIWTNCPKCFAPLRRTTNGWSCTNLNCGCRLDVYGNQYTNTTYEVNYRYERDEIQRSSPMDMEEAKKIEESSQSKIVEVVEDVDGTKEDPEKLVRLVYDLIYNNGGPWYR